MEVATSVDNKFVNVRCCSASTVAVTDKGEVYSWGSNTKGELGCGICTDAIGVHKVKLPTKVVIGITEFLFFDTRSNLFQILIMYACRENSLWPVAHSCTEQRESPLCLG